MFGLSNSALEAILHLFSLVLPEGHCIPDTLDKRKVVHDLGLDYQKIDACVNDCVLFRKSYAHMSKCPTVVSLGGKLQMMKRQVAVLQPRNVLHIKY
jgi:hypothetical protein